MKRGGFLRTEMWRDYLKTALAWWRDKGSANLKAFFAVCMASDSHRRKL
jgi:hypothetical protein